jgi:hypothetical protein
VSAPKKKTIVQSGIAIIAVLIAGAVNSLTQQGDKPATESKPAAVSNIERLQAYDTGKIIGRKGKEIIVTGKVSSTVVSQSSGHQFLNFSGAKLRVICFKEDLAAWPAGGPAKLYRDKTVEIQGTVDIYKDAPQIRVLKPDQIRLYGASAATTPAGPFALKKTATDTWQSPAGLIYTGRDPQGKTRIEHILRHSIDQPSRVGSHGVFNGGEAKIFPLIDEAYLIAKKKNTRPKTEGGSITYTIPMGRKIGYLGGRTGASRKNPPLTRVFIVMKRGTTNIITAYPK